MDPEIYEAATSGTIDLFLEPDWSLFLKETPEKNSALHLAVNFKQKNFAEKLIALHPQLLYHTNSKGDTPLHIAARVGCLEITMLLTSHLYTESLEVEANQKLLRMVNVEKDTALHDAVRYGHYGIVNLLITEDPELGGFINDNGESPLFMAVDRRLFGIACHLLKSARDCSYQGRNKMNALHAAIIRHDLNSVLPVLARIPFNPVICYYRTLQSLVIFYYRILKIRNKLTKKHPDNQLEEKLGTKGSDFMRAFIQKCPNAIKEADEFGWTPLHYAAYLCDTEAVQMLLENDKQVPHHAYQKDKEGLSALHIAAKEGHIRVMKQLIESFPDTCELLDERGRTALHVAVENGTARAVKYVLKTPGLEVLINVKDKGGNTSLHLAAIHGHYKILIMLLDDWRVDKKAMNKERLTATEIILSKMELRDWGKEDGQTQFDDNAIEIILSKMELRDFQKARITTKMLLAGGLPSLEGVVCRENTDNKNVGMKEQTQLIERKEESVEEQEILSSTLERKESGEPTKPKLVKSSTIDRKGKQGEDKELKYLRLKEIAGTHILVATIIATVTFAAGFTMPGGYRSGEPTKPKLVKSSTIDRKGKQGEDKELKYLRLKEIAGTHILVATIIATVTFAAGFTMPGGYRSEGPDEGMANLSRKTAFRAFLIADTMAFCFSVISLYYHFFASIETNHHRFEDYVRFAALHTNCSIIAMVIAFISGTNVVLAGTSELAISNLVVGCFFLVLLFCLT